MIITVDSNIIFSAILNTKSSIGDLLFNSYGIFEFRSCHFLLNEINKHWSKIQKASKLSNDELEISRRLVYNQITFIDEQLIPKRLRQHAFNLVKDIDEKDFVFIALNDYQESNLWSGDKKLVNGLRAKGYKNVMFTDELFELRDSLEKRSKGSK